MRRLPERARGPLQDRAPVSTYDQAVKWLVREYDFIEKPLALDESLPEAAVLVCDLFWVTEHQLRNDILKDVRFYNNILADGPDRRRRVFSRRS